MSSDVDVIPGLRERFVASFDGTPLCVQVIDDPLDGPIDGPSSTREKPKLLLVNGIGVTVAGWRLTVARFRKDFTIVSFDTRGLHRSGRPVGGAAALDVDAHARDVVAVADAMGFTRFHALGWSMGVQVLIEAAKLLGDRLQTLALHNGVAGLVFSGLLGATLGTAVFGKVVDPVLARAAKHTGFIERCVQLVTHHPALVPTFVRTGFLHHAIDDATFVAMARSYTNLDVEVFCTILRHLGRHDAWDALPAIAVPVIVVAGSNDRLTPLSTMQRMVARLPRAELVVLSAGTHYACMELPGMFHDALAVFWQKHGVLSAPRPAGAAP